jgi:tRNA pseudouridine55 synthase
MEAQAIPLATLEALKANEDIAGLDALLQPADTALLHLPRVELAESSTFYMLQGQAVTVPNAPTEGIVRMYTDSGQLLGIGEMLEDGRVGPKRLLATN